MDDEITLLADGDVRWVFPTLRDPGPVQEHLAQADARLRGLADFLGVRENQDGDGGFCFQRVGGIQLAGMFGVVMAAEVAQVDKVEFRAGVWFPRRCAWDLRWGPPWHVEASIEATCDAGIDCGLHIVGVTEADFGSPLEAAQGLATACDWLAERGRSKPLSFWAEGVQQCDASTG